MSKLRLDPRTLLSALVIVFAFPPWDLSFLLWFALIPWLSALARAKSARDAAIQGLWLSFWMTMGGFYWLAYAIHQYGELPWAVGVLGLILFGIGNQLQFPVFGILFHRLWKRDAHLNVTTSSLLAAAYVAVDYLVPKLFRDTLGHAFYNASYIRMVADLGGALLLSYLVVMLNLGLWQLVHIVKRRGEPSLLPAIKRASPVLALSGALMLAAISYSVWKTAFLETAEKAATRIPVAAIQGNIGDFDKLAAESGFGGSANQVLRTFFELSDQALRQTPKPLLLIWPETTYPSLFRSPRTASELERDQSVENYVKTRGVPLVFGGYSRRDKKDFNSVFILEPQARVHPDKRTQSGSSTGNSALADRDEERADDLQIYRKSILLPFGEYIPGFGKDSVFKRLFPAMGFFGTGEGPETYTITIDTPSKSGQTLSLWISPIVCYEALYPEYVIEGARQGSQLIVNVTNDSWFSPYGEPYLHLALSAFRSIETNLPQLRSTNTGISALILPTGAMPVRTGVGEKTILSAQVPFVQGGDTFMTRWGDWMGQFCIAVCVGWAGVWFKGRRRRKR